MTLKYCKTVLLKIMMNLIAPLNIPKKTYQQVPIHVCIIPILDTDNRS